MPLTRSWLPKAATIWVDMERGIYDWSQVPKELRRKPNSTSVVRTQVLRDCGVSPNYRRAQERIWESPEFQRLLKEERARRDHALIDAARELEAVTGPIREIGDRMVTILKERLDADPEEFTTKELLQYGPAWVKLGLEVEGKVESQKALGIEHVLSRLAANNSVTEAMMGQALNLVKEYREMQDRKFASAGFDQVIEGECDDE
jgi:hypothetical protein